MTIVKLSLVAVSAATVVVVAAAAGSRAGEATGVSCRRGTVAAVVDAKRVCLRAGAPCRARFERQYERYGFRCRRGVLVGKPHPPAVTPPTTTTSTAPAPPPANPFIGTWWAIDPTDGSLQEATFAADGGFSYSDDHAQSCGGVAGFATAHGNSVGNTWTASAPTTLFCPDNGGAISGHLFQFTLNPDGTLTATGTPDIWTRARPAR